ncbi:ABC transporter ATP-binding protein [Thermocatellispora tengchongensis]
MHIPETPNTNTDGRPERLLILREIFRGRRVRLASIMLLALASTAGTLLLPWTVGHLLSAIQQGEGFSRWTWLMIAVGIGSGTANAAGTYLLSRMGHRLVCRLRVRSMRHSLRLGVRAAREEGTGNLATRLTSDAGAVKSIIDVGPIQIPMAMITLVGTLVIMGVLDWVLLLITLGAFLVALGIVTVVVVGLRRKYLAIQEGVGALTEDFVAAMEALTIIKAHGAEDAVSARLSGQADRIAETEIGASRLEALMVPVITLGQQVALVAVILGGGARIVSGDLSLGSFVAFLLYLFQLVAPLIMAMSATNTVQMGLAARKRFDDLFALPVEQAERAAGDGDVVPDEHAPAVRFEGVTFAYGEEPVLRQVNLEVPARGLTAMVGLSGSGKTTVLGLIERFMDPDSGRIEVFGQDATRWPLEALRRRLAYVDQGNTLLRDTVRNNLTLGQDVPVDDEALVDALRRVGLEESALLEEGLDTVLGGAHDLSGGQRQRLALARASLSDAP